VSWVKYWMVEFFCDLFGVFVLGPAYAWSHLHLSAKRGGNPFEVQLVSVSSHPADDARMRAMLFGLEAAGFTAEAAEIGSKWEKLLHYHDIKPEPEYHRCYPDDVLRQVAAHALRGVRGIGCRIASSSTSDQVHGILNQAWKELWNAPESYTEWEKLTVAAL
jgi:hypothetical protein